MSFYLIILCLVPKFNLYNTILYPIYSYLSSFFTVQDTFFYNTFLLLNFNRNLKFEVLYEKTILQFLENEMNLCKILTSSHFVYYPPMFVHNSLTTFRKLLQLEKFSFECSFEELIYFLNISRWSLPQGCQTIS